MDMDLVTALSMKPGEVKAEAEEAARLRRLDNQKGVFRITLNSEAPTVICDCMAFLRAHGLETEGLFRIPGKADLVEDIKAKYEAYNEEGHGKIKRDVLNSPEFKNLQVHDVATLMKAYFRELHESLVPLETQELFMDALVNIDSKRGKISRYAEVLADMVTPNRECFCFLVSFLREVALFENVNKMTHVNLATCFAPSVFRSANGRTGTEALLDLQMGINIMCDILSYLPVDQLHMPSKATVEENTQYKGAQAPAPPPRGRHKAPPGLENNGRALPALPTRNTSATSVPPGLNVGRPGPPTPPKR